MRPVPQESAAEAPTETPETTYQAEPAETSAVQAEAGDGAITPAGPEVSIGTEYDSTPQVSPNPMDTLPETPSQTVRRRQRCLKWLP